MIRSLYSLLIVLLSAISLQAQVTANFTFSPATGCAPAVIQFTNTSTGAVSYSWNFGNSSSPSTLTNPSTTYTSIGTYTITLIATASNGATSTKTSTITINPAPTVTFSATPTAACPGTTVQFTGTATANMTPSTMTYVWDFGNGVNSSSQNPSYTYNNPGNYNVAFAAVNSAGCTTLVQQPAMITIYSRPVVSFTASDTALCNAPATTLFSNGTTGSTPISYNWYFGDNTQSTSTSPSKTYSSLGTYTVKLVATDNHGCKDSFTRPNYITLASPPLAQFTAPTSACPNTNITLSAGGTGVNRTWYFSDGTSSVGNVVNKSFSTPGAHWIKLVSNTGLCSDSITKNITINPLPAPAFTLAPSRPCPNPNNSVQFTNNTPGTGNTYQWQFGDGSTSSLISPSYAYPPGIYTVTLTATTSLGCVDSLKLVDTVRAYPLSLNFQALPAGGCAPLTVQFDKNPESVLNGVAGAYPAAITSYTWSFGDGSPNVTGSTAPSHTYTSVGTYVATLTVTTANGCTVSETKNVLVGSGSTPAFTASKLVVCAHAYDTLTTTTPNSGNTIYQWFVGPNLVLTGGPYQIVTFADTGYVTVKLVVINNGCADTLIKTDYIYVSPPVSISNVLFSCDSPKKVTFLNLSKGATSSKWYYGNGSSIITNANSFSYTYASLGDYPAALVTTNSASGCTDSINFFVTLFKPSYNLTVDDSTICKSSNMPTSLLSSVITGAPVSNYSWRIAGGINTNVTYADTLANIIYSFVDTGHYTIRVKAIDGHGCVDSAVKPGYVTVSKPYVKFGGAPQIGCAPQPVQFADSSRLVSGTSTVSRVWDFGDVVSLSGNVATPSHTYASAGSFDVKLVVTDNNGCSDSLTKPSYINIQSPKAAFTGGGQGCPGVPVSFINGSLGGTAVTYEWDFGDGTPISTVINPQHIYANTGIYTVRLIAKSPNGCRDTATKNGFVIIGQRPTASFSQSDTFSICSPKLVQFTNTSTGAASYNWSFGNNASSTVTSPTNVYSGGGVYTVRLIASSNTGCKDTAYGSVHLLGSAGGLSYGPLTGCEPLTVNFTTAVVNVPSFIFDFGDGSTFGTTGTTASHTYAQAGTYIPKLIMTDNTGCSSSSIGLDTVKVDGVVAGFTTDPNPVCGGGTVKFIDTSKGTYSTVVFRQWDFGNGITSTSANPTQTYNAPGSYPVSMYSRTSSGCVDTFRTVLKVHPIPVINAGTDTVICLNDAATLQPAGGVSYTWSPGATLNCTACTNPEAKPTVPTDYIVIGTDSNGCKDSDTVLVGIKTKTTALIAGGGGVCAGDGLQLSASGAQSYQWIPSTGLSNANVANPFATPASTMTYTVIAKEGSCIPDTERVTVVVNPIPTVNAGPDVTMVAGNSVQLSAITQVSGVSFNWTPATRLSCDNCSDPEASPKTTTTYTVTTKSPFGCTDTDAVTIYVICEQNQVYIPNTFTPNGDGDNELFYPRGKGIEIIKTFRVFNRWGEKVFEKMNIPANDAGNAWDGSYKGAPLPPDVFVFIIEGVCDTGEEFRWQGDVGLVR